MPAGRRWSAVVALLAALAACSSDASGTAPATTTTAPTTTSATIDDRVYEVVSRTETFVDPSRGTRENAGAPARPDRTLETLLLLPDGEGPFPLVLFSHGLTASGPRYQGLLERIAAEGYVVAAPTFPLSSGGRPDAPFLGDYVEQPADIRFLLGEVAALLPDVVDADRVAAAGHSLGGITTLGLAFDPCCADPRIDAFVAIAGAQLPFPGDGEADFAGRRPPVLLIHGTADGTVPFGASQSVFERATGPKALVTLVDGPHSPFGPPWGDVVVSSIVDFLDFELGGDPTALERLAEDADVEGVATLQQAGLAP